MFAQILNNKVEEIAESTYPVSSSMEWVDIGDNKLGIKNGWGYVDAQFQAPIIPPVDPKIAIRKEIETLRNSIQDAVLDYSLGNITKADLQKLKDQLTALEAELGN